MKDLTTALLAISLAACSRDPAADSRGAPSAHPSAVGPTNVASKTSAAKHMEASLGRCAFSFDTRVPLTAATDNTADRSVFTGSGDSPVIFAAYREEGARAKTGARSLDDLVKRAERKGKIKWIEKGTSNGTYLALWDNDGGESHDEYAIEAEGLAAASTAELKCSFTCSGPRARLKDVVDLCTSVRVTIK